LADDVRAEFQQLSQAPHLKASDVQARVAKVCGRIDDAARTLKETLGALPAQHDRSSATPAADRAQPSTRHKWTSFGR
jgi:hypothetical protein